MTVMTDPPCRGLITLALIAEPSSLIGSRSRRIAWADRLVEARWLRLTIADYSYGDELPVRDAIAPGAAPGQSLGNVGVDGLSVHQLLQPVHLVDYARRDHGD